MPINAPEAGSCPSSGIKYLTKTGSPVSTTTTKTSTSTTTKATGTSTTKTTSTAVSLLVHSVVDGSCRAADYQDHNGDWRADCDPHESDYTCYSVRFSSRRAALPGNVVDTDSCQLHAVWKRQQLETLVVEGYLRGQRRSVRLW